MYFKANRVKSLHPVGEQQSLAREGGYESKSRSGLVAILGTHIFLASVQGWQCAFKKILEITKEMERKKSSANEYQQTGVQMTVRACRTRRPRS